jgi:hypothetical protein
MPSSVQQVNTTVDELPPGFFLVAKAPTAVSMAEAIRTNPS